MFNLPGYATHLYKVHFTSFYFNTLAENNTKVVQLEINGISHSELAATGEKFWEARSDVDFVGVSSTTIMPTGYARNLLYACGEGLSPDEIERFGQHVSEKSGVNISSTRRMGF